MPTKTRVRLLCHHDVYNPGETPVVSSGLADLWIRNGKAERVESVEVPGRTEAPGGVLPDPIPSPLDAAGFQADKEDDVNKGPDTVKLGIPVGGEDEENKANAPVQPSELRVEPSTLVASNTRDHAAAHTRDKPTPAKPTPANKPK